MRTLLWLAYKKVCELLNNTNEMLATYESHVTQLTCFGSSSSINVVDIFTRYNKLGFPISFKLKIWARSEFNTTCSQVCITDIFLKDVDSAEDIVSKILHLTEQSNKDFKQNKLKYDDSLRQFNLFKEGTEKE